MWCANFIGFLFQFPFLYLVILSVFFFKLECLAKRFFDYNKDISSQFVHYWGCEETVTSGRRFGKKLCIPQRQTIGSLI